MTISAQLPDGRTLEFPDGTSTSVIQRTVRQQLGIDGQQPSAVEQQPQVARGRILPFTRNLETGELEFDITAGLTGAIIEAVTLPARVTRGEVDVSTEEGIRRNIGEVIGLAGLTNPATIRGAGRIMPPRPDRPSITVPTIDQLTVAKNIAYRQASDAGVFIRAERFTDFGTQLREILAKEGFRRRLEPRIQGGIDEIDDILAGGTISFDDLDGLRKVWRRIGESNVKSERRLAQIAIEQIDEFVKNLTQSDTTGGDLGTARKALFQARNLYRRAAKGQDIQNLLERAELKAAQFSQSGAENAIRSEFRQLALNERRLRGFTKEEREAIRAVARGGPLNNFFRLVGKLSPTGPVPFGASVGGGFLIGGPVGAIVTPAVGFAARRAATIGTRRAGIRAGELVRRGGPLPSRTAALGRGLVSPGLSIAAGAATIQSLGASPFQGDPLGP